MRQEEKRVNISLIETKLLLRTICGRNDGPWCGQAKKFINELRILIHVFKKQKKKKTCERLFEQDDPDQLLQLITGRRRD